MPPSMWESLQSLPPEIIEPIYYHIPKNVLLVLRFLPNYLGSIATSEAFRTLQLKPDAKLPEHFINIAKSARLRQLVREIRCDTYVKEFEQRIDETISIDYSVYRGSLGFMEALDYIRYFSHLETFHLQFNEHFSWADNPETHLRNQVLIAVFDSLAGSWSMPTSNNRPDCEGGSWFCRDARDSPFNKVHKMPQNTSKIPISTLSIQNLGYMEGTDVANIDSMRRTLASGQITTLLLHTTDATTILEDEDGTARTVETDSEPKYEFYESLNRTWLFPQAAENLRELSVTAEELWGWTPHKDIHNFATGREFPNLKILTLESYVFGFQCQVDWLQSLSLERLSLNRCAVLFRTFNTTPIEFNSVIVGQDPEGNDIVSRDCPNPEWWQTFSPGLVVSPLPLRWHSILNQWRNTMNTLRHFKMGSGEAKDFRYVDNVGETFCYEFDDDETPGSWNHEFTLEPGTRKMEREALDCFISQLESRNS